MKKSSRAGDTFNIPSDLEIYALIQKWSLAFQNGGDRRGVQAIGFFAHYALKELLSLSQRGNKQPLGRLIEILTHSVNEFDLFCRHELSHLPKNYDRKSYPDGMDVRDFARRKWVWPGLLSRDADLVKDNETLVEQLGLASEVGVNFSKKSKRMWTRKTPEVAVALRLYNIVNSYRTEFHFNQMTKIRPGNGQVTNPFKKDFAEWEQSHRGFGQTEKLAQKLAPLDRQNYTQWFKAAEPVFIQLYGADFEKDSTFADYWRRDAYMENKPGNNRAKQLKANAPALIRSDIKRQIKQAFRSIAPKSPAVG